MRTRPRLEKTSKGNPQLHVVIAREAAVLWERLTAAVGSDARDAVWQHPDLLPGAEDLDEPAAFIDRMVGGDTSGFDEAIADLERNQDES